MENLPAYVNIVFILVTVLTVLMFYMAARRSPVVLVVLVGWLVVQAVLSLKGFYTITKTVPPRLVFLIAPPLVCIAVLFLTAAGRRFTDNLNLRTLTILHIIRIPVEVVLYWLLLNKAIPEIMTFDGRNFDIVSGLSAPIIFYFAFSKTRVNKKLLLAWNIICLILLVNVVVYALLSAPSPLQKFAFDQPNVAIMYFPFAWLPSCVVPLVLLSHLSAIRQLTRAGVLTQIGS